MSSTLPRPGSRVWILFGIVLTSVLAVAAFVPVVPCPIPRCYAGYQELVRCLNVARSGGYPANVVQMYEDQIRERRCPCCNGKGRATLLERLIMPKDSTSQR